MRAVVAEVPPRPVDGEEPRAPDVGEVHEREEHDADTAELEVDVEPHAVRLHDRLAVVDDPAVDQRFRGDPGGREAPADHGMLVGAGDHVGPDPFASGQIGAAPEQAEQGVAAEPQRSGRTETDRRVEEVPAGALAGAPRRAHHEHGAEHERDERGGQEGGGRPRAHEQEGGDRDPHPEQHPSGGAHGQPDREHDDRDEHDGGEEVGVAEHALDAAAVEEVVARPVDDRIQALVGDHEAREHRPPHEHRHHELEEQRQPHDPFGGRRDGANDVAPGEHGSHEQALEGRDHQQEPGEHGCRRPGAPGERRGGPRDVAERQPRQAAHGQRRSGHEPEDRGDHGGGDDDDGRRHGADGVDESHTAQRQHEDEHAPGAQQQVPGRLARRRGRQRRHRVVRVHRHGDLRVAGGIRDRPVGPLG